MKITNHARVTNILAVVWGISYSTMAIVSNVYISMRARMGDLSPNDPLSIYQIVTTSLVVLYFYPLLWIIQHHAKLASKGRIMIAARILIALLSYWILCVLIMWCIEI